LGSHWPRASRREDPAPRDRSSSRRAPPERGVELSLFQRVEQRACFSSAQHRYADQEQVAIGDRLAVGVDDQPAPTLAAQRSRNSIISRNL
jgi:hypothetical protein